MCFVWFPCEQSKLCPAPKLSAQLPDLLGVVVLLGQSQPAANAGSSARGKRDSHVSHDQTPQPGF